MAFFIFATIYKTLGGENKNDAPTTPNFDLFFSFLFFPYIGKKKKKQSTTATAFFIFIFSPLYREKRKKKKNYPYPNLYRHAPHPLCRGAARREIKHTISNYMPLIPGQRNKRGGEMDGHRAGIQANRERTERHTRARARANPKKFYLCSVEPKPKDDEQQRQQTAHDARCNVKMPGLCRPGNRAHDARMCMPGSVGEREQAHRRRDTRTEFIIQTIGSRPGAADV